MTKIHPEDIPAEEWELVTAATVLEMYEAYKARKIRRKNEKIMGGYGLVTYRPRKK